MGTGKQIKQIPNSSLYRIALAGQPNVGKSTVFNLLTGMRQHVGNWPGKTVEKKTGVFSNNGNEYLVVDLPGTYSLSANSPEELIARDYLVIEQPDLVVVVVNAAALERNLYLVAELLSLTVPIVIALNMLDVAEAEGQKILPDVLESSIGTKVIPMVASKKQGKEGLLDAIHDEIHGDGAKKGPVSLPKMRDDHRVAIEGIHHIIAAHVTAPYPEDWIALKLLEGDKVVLQLMNDRLPEKQWHSLQTQLEKHDHTMLAVVEGRHEWIKEVSRHAVEALQKQKMSLTKRWDRWATHPVYGYFLMLGILIGGFVVTLLLAGHVTGFLFNKALPAASSWVAGSIPTSPPWLEGLIVKGVIGGVGMVISFMPILIGFFALFAVLEDIGYLSRVAYLMNRFLKKIGLDGKSFMPLCYGLICNIPAVMGARVIQSYRARIMTVLLTPFVPCGAQIMIAAFLASIFFSQFWAVIVVVGMIVFNFLILGFTGMLLKRLALSKDQTGLIMELPLYHRPNFKTVSTQVVWRTREYLVRAGTVILAASVVVWWLSSYPTGELKTSYMGLAGGLLSPLADLMGLDWKMMVSLFTSFIARENTLATLGVLYSLEGTGGLGATLKTAITPAGALAFIVVNMLFMPCIGTIGVMYSESKSFKWVGITLLYMMMVAFILGILTYQITKWFL